MRISVPRERKAGERRVGLSPAGVDELVSGGHEVVVERGAGRGSGMSDDDYSDAGAVIVDRDEAWSGELVVKVKEPIDDEPERLEPGQTVFTFLHLAGVQGLAERLASSGATAIAYELVGSRQAGFPILAPMSEIAGQLGMLAAARFLMATEDGRGLLAGMVPGVTPAKVVVLGGGIAGSAAARSALGLGAEVAILERDANRVRALSDRFMGSAKVLYSTSSRVEEEIVDADVLIGSVLIPGRQPPKLVEKDHLRFLRDACVLVDIAIDQGGCFATSRATTHAEPVFRLDGAIHYCVANMPAAVPRTATAALTNATLPYVLALAEGVEGAVDRSPELHAAVAVRSGSIWEPEAVAV